MNPKDADTESPSGTQSLLRGLQLMELLSHYANGCPLAKLAEDAGMSKSTTHRLLQGLQRAGYVTPAPTYGSYRLTSKCVAIGQRALSSLNVIHVSASHLEALNLDCGETVNLSAMENGRAILIYKLDPIRGMIRTRAHIGQSMPFHCSAMGKLFLAHNQREDLQDFWEAHREEIIAHTPNTITDWAVMAQALDEIRKRGYAIDQEEHELGICCVAAPIFDITGQMPYAASVSLSSAKFTHVGEKSLVEKVSETARRISEELGGNPPPPEIPGLRSCL